MDRLGFPRARRLTRRPEYLACYERGRRHYTRSLVVFILPRPGEAHWRVGVAASRKLGSAVRRNRIKRVVREFFRLHPAAVPPGTDLVVVPKRGIDVKRFDLELLRNELLPLLAKQAGGDRPGTAGDRPRGTAST